MMMRNTWLNRDQLQEELGYKIKIVFVVGMTNDTAVLQRLDYEQELYGDIVQSDFIDSYQNNTFKVISSLRYG